MTDDISRISRQGDVALLAPEHRHDGVEGVCTDRHLVEPLDDRTSVYLRGLSIEQIVTQHEHGEDGGMLKEGEVALDLMNRLRVFCNQRGHHTHGMATDVTSDKTYNSSPMAHHHHDLRCLVEAGANEVRPELKRVRESLGIMTRSQEHFRRRADEEADAKRVAWAANRALREEMDRMRTFMLSMPAVGPWESIRDQYDSWCDEQNEKADEDQQDVSVSDLETLAWVKQDDLPEEALSQVRLNSQGWGMGTTVAYGGVRYIKITAEMADALGIDVVDLPAVRAASEGSNHG